MWTREELTAAASIKLTPDMPLHVQPSHALRAVLAEPECLVPAVDPLEKETSIRGRFFVLVEVIDAELARLLLAKRKKDVEEEEEFDDEEEEDDDLEDEEDDEDDEFDDEEDEFEEEFEDDDLDDDDDDIFYDDDDDE